jgi:lipoate-protein ligase A
VCSSDLEGLGIDTARGAITAREEELAETAFAEEIGTDAFVAEIDTPAEDARHASITGKGGTIEAFVRLEGEGTSPRIREALITGDFFVTPPRTVFDLEAALRGATSDEVRPRIEAFFAAAEIGLLSAAASDFADAVEAAFHGRDVST